MLLAVHNRSPAAHNLTKSTVSKKGITGGKKYYSRHNKPQNCLENKPHKSGKTHFVASRKGSYKPINHNKNNHSEEEEIIGYAGYGNHGGEKSPTVFGNKKFHRQKQKREEYDGFVKVVEEDIIYRKSRKCVKKSAYSCGFGGTGKPSDIAVGCKGAKCEFQY